MSLKYPMMEVAFRSARVHLSHKSMPRPRFVPFTTFTIPLVPLWAFAERRSFAWPTLSENLVVVTRTRQDSLGQKLEYLANGEVDVPSITSVPRKVGTTVAVSKLFHALPVRRADFIKRIKAQRSKVVSMMQGCTFYT